ncbi:hypothetical protein C8P63_12634 [Melghirimyces profundicolus]|uniref:Uncharacterized protein n=1 Tax=Melghirimyces profundicolus TaxID=1242148 RepID=A0A2T6BCI9_9BACL|nr:hypothetical protein [Melghirimyces profundicolus]PTX53746.1 hypothetical protein C8P63_12634 [Melghirimyces profundicolus]
MIKKVKTVKPEEVAEIMKVLRMLGIRYSFKWVPDQDAFDMTYWMSHHQD